jgi:hypothetical protein
MAAAAVGKAIGADKPPQGNEDSITNALATAMANPDQLLALKKAEQEFQIKMNEMGLDLEKIAADDRASARAMQVATKSWIPGVLAVGVSIGFFGLLTMLLLHAPPPSSEKVLDVMTGSLGTAWIMVMGYYFGSSAGSAAKDATLSRIASQ